MLVLSRKFGERIVIPECGLSIAVVAIDGKTVRLGISAPAEVNIYREEVWQRMVSSTHAFREEFDQQDGGRHERH
jgi:carbon storage regulator